MRVLVLNCGSSSLESAVVDPESGAHTCAWRAGRIGIDGSFLRGPDGETTETPLPDHAAAMSAVLPRLLADGPPDAVGHRIVHGGERFVGPTWIDDDALEALDALAPLAPLHNPPQVAAVRAARAALPELPHVAVFDTAFHATLPPRARHYAIPHEAALRHGLRRYGFHGTSHGWVAQHAAEFLETPLGELRLITCHLGNGASVTAVEHGRSIETSMGMTPLEGLVMGTRAGDLDVGLALSWAREAGLDLDALDHQLNRESGLLGISGSSSDMRDIEARAAEGDDRARLALNVYCHRLRKYIGAYAAVLGGVDAIVFTAGIGENSSVVRHRAAQRLEYLGARLDEERNRTARVGAEAPVAEISTATSRVRILVAHSDEEHAIAQQTRDLIARRAREAGRSERFEIPVAISARHVHLTDEAVATLFGPGAELEPHTPLSQPGQFAAEQTVDLVGPKRRLPAVRVVGPTRGHCQVEISRSDEFHLGLDAPIRCSGDLAGTPGLTLEGPAGSLVIEEGVICAQRHIHMTPADADHFDVSHKDTVRVEIDSAGRDMVFGDVVVRVKDSYKLEMHVDTDEGNAAELVSGTRGVLCETRAHARLSKI